jgi:hypothetical protein
MKTFLALALLFAGSLFAGSRVTLGWESPPGPVVGYVMYERLGTNYVARGIVTNSTPGTVTGTITNLPPGEHCFVVTAFNEWGESDVSNEACADIGELPGVPIGLTVQNVGSDKPAVFIIFTTP